MVKNKCGSRETISEARDGSDMDEKVAFPILLSIPAPNTNLARGELLNFIYFSVVAYNSGPLHWELTVLATGPPGKSPE